MLDVVWVPTCPIDGNASVLVLAFNGAAFSYMCLLSVRLLGVWGTTSICAASSCASSRVRLLFVQLLRVRLVGCDFYMCAFYMYVFYLCDI